MILQEWLAECKRKPMPAEKEFPVHGDDGLRGVLLAPTRFLDDAPERKIRLDDGRELTVPSEALEPQRDGSFYLRSLREATPAEPIAEPPVRTAAVEEAAMPPVPDEPLLREDCDIERVSVRKLIDRPAETRQEGDTLIVPLMEEIWVVEKRLMLREELHIRRKTLRHSDGKPVRREDLEASGG